MHSLSEVSDEVQAAKHRSLCAITSFEQNQAPGSLSGAVPVCFMPAATAKSRAVFKVT
jgi:hypothetical protein